HDNDAFLVQIAPSDASSVIKLEFLRFHTASGLSGRSALTLQVAAAGWTPDIDEYRRKTSAWVADIDPLQTVDAQKHQWPIATRNGPSQGESPEGSSALASIFDPILNSEACTCELAIARNLFIDDHL
ncbi:hypothetical protein, partial [Robbsia andropogonis]|uniref:hypothetical protein n=1 Tax=Robbsia andropogonis TaxID=28092 RepID=UPI003D1C95F4